MELQARYAFDADVVAIRSAVTSPFITAEPLPTEIEQAVQEVATLRGLPPRWLNGAASSDFALGLPPGYDARLVSTTYGGLTVSFAHRTDLVAWKLQAAVDQLGGDERHLQDLLLLRPTADEIEAARAWYSTIEVESSGFWTNLATIVGGLDG